MQHFLKETDFKPYQIAELFSIAHTFKRQRKRHTTPSLAKQSWGLLFFKKSTRTRVSFEVGISELGGNAVVLNSEDLQLSRGESTEDTAKVLSRYLHGVIIRAHAHELVETFACAASIPVVNALTDFLHPCQLYADAFTLAERWRGKRSGASLEVLKGRKVVFIGDSASNMANSWMLAAGLFEIDITVCGPKEFAPQQPIRALLKKENFTNYTTFTSNPLEAVRDADVVYTDVWVSMGDESEAAVRLEKMRPYAVTPQLMAAARPDACFMHCMPVHAGEEVTLDVLESPQSIIVDQAENRLHMQKALLSVLAHHS